MQEWLFCFVQSVYKWPLYPICIDCWIAFDYSTPVIFPSAIAVDNPALNQQIFKKGHTAIISSIFRPHYPYLVNGIAQLDAFLYGYVLRKPEMDAGVHS